MLVDRSWSDGQARACRQAARDAGLDGLNEGQLQQQAHEHFEGMTVRLQKNRQGCTVDGGVGAGEQGEDPSLSQRGTDYLLGPRLYKSGNLGLHSTHWSRMVPTDHNAASQRMS